MIQLIESDDWLLVYRDGQRVYSGHGGYGWAEAMRLTGATVHIANVDYSDGMHIVEDILGFAPEQIDELAAKFEQANIPLVFKTN